MVKITAFSTWIFWKENWDNLISPRSTLVFPAVDRLSYGKLLDMEGNWISESTSTRRGFVLRSPGGRSCVSKHRIKNTWQVRLLYSPKHSPPSLWAAPYFPVFPYTLQLVFQHFSVVPCQPSGFLSHSSSPAHHPAHHLLFHSATGDLIHPEGLSHHTANKSPQVTCHSASFYQHLLNTPMVRICNRC